MKKKVALLTVNSSIGGGHRRTLETLFGDEIELHCYSYDDGNIVSIIQADVFVISIYQIYLNIRQFLPPDAKTIIINHTLTEEQYRKVAKLPAGKSVLLVNISFEVTMESISLFQQLGLNHLEFVPCYPGVVDLPRLEVAVTPGEQRYVPPFVKQVVDIGDRVMDIHTIMEIATAIGLERLLGEKPFTEHFKGLRKNLGSVTSLYGRTSILEGQLSSLLDILDEGIVIIENTGVVYAGNRKAYEVLGTDVDFVGVHAAKLIPGIPFNRVLESGAGLDYTLVKINSRNISVKVVPVIAKGGNRGALAIVNTFEEKEKSQHRLRSQLLGKGHRSRYTFDDILTKNAKLLEIKELARLKAKSDASVLIIGETGTGKELFAHAIHGSSRRKGWQFVTVNCAALPESLLESELFGYEEGAFTGARKGGKPGLFELAHKGTIFLDEIGEMNLNLQARLLRVLESREVMRIGGDSMINVDIRIISATNKELWKYVQKGTFRKDLFYRLNVLPIEVPPLRNRKEDIVFLMQRMLKKMEAEVILSADAEATLIHYPWYGNIRELKNLAEYIAYLNKKTIESSDLLPLLKWDDLEPANEVHAERSTPRTLEPRKDESMFILGCLYDSYKQKTRVGRRGLSERALERDIYLTENQIRKLLFQMESSGLVRMLYGRGRYHHHPIRDRNV